MKKFSTLKWFVALFFLSVISFSLITDLNVTNNFKSIRNQGYETEKAIQFCPAYPGLIKKSNPDGTIISFYLKGDEVLHWQVTPEGYTLLENDKGYYCYATQDSKGNLIPSDVVATDTKSQSKLAFPKNLTFSKSQITEALKLRNELFHPIASFKTTGSKTKGTTTGVRKVLVLLIDFQDRPFTHTRQEYDNMMNMEGYNGTGSFKDYYKAVSYNQLTCETTVKGPYHANGTMAKYGANINGNKYINAKLLVQEAVDAAEADGVNYADYDNDGDGYVDAVIVVHSNNDEAVGAGSNALWSHQSALRYNGMQRTYDGVTIDVYNIDPGVSGASGDAMATIGVFCHEFGHALGLPDTYDIDYSGALTPGNWDVMDMGSYNNNSRTPSYHNPWARTKLGWQAPVVINNPAIGLTIADCSTNKDLFRVNTDTKGEYYILENRQQTGYNQYVYGHGMLVWKIDSVYISTAGNGVNTSTTHQGVALVRADNATTNGAGNTFPGTSSITSLTDETTPSMRSYDGKRVYKPISNIQETSGSISFDFIQSLATTDVGVTSITNPNSGISGGGSVNVTAKVKNFGSAAISNFPISYTLNSGTPVSETYTNTLAVGEIADYTFATQVTLPVGDNTITVATAATGDAISDNNTVTKSVSIFSAAFSFPFSENFEGATFPPVSWTVINPDVAQGVWTQKTAIGINGTSTKTAFIDYWNYAGTTDQLLTPPINLTSATSPVLTFNYAYHKTNPDGLAIQISIDFGATYTTVWQKTGVDLATVPGEGDSGDPLNDFTPTAANQWRTVNIDLTSFVGHNVIVSFTGISANGDNIYIDDVSVATSTCVLPSSAKNFSVTNLTKNSATINWERGDGTGVIVLQRAIESIDGAPQNGTTYNVNDMIGSSKVIFVGTATSQDLTDLTPATLYNYAVYEVSSTNCYSSILSGSLTTLGLATVNTLTVRDLQATSATILANVTNMGEAPVTERGICYSTNYSTLGVDYDHVTSQRGSGEFETSLTNLSPASYYYVVAYAINTYGIAYGNVMTFYTIGGCDVLNYSASMAANTTGTYTDLGTNGSLITVANNDDANSSPVDIGFPFVFNCLTFDKFILNTNGFIKLGTTEPSAAGLFITSPQTQSESGFFSKDGKDIFLLAPFNCDLTSGSSTAQFRVYTTGTTPNRVTTIQFKNLKDKSKSVNSVNYLNQFTNIEFQIKLYETTNVIEFIYGTFTPSANTDAFRYAMVGIKGGGYGSDNLISAYKGSSTAWSSAAFYSEDYTATFAFKRSVNVTAGRIFRFTPYVANDASVADIYVPTNLPTEIGMPQTVSADIKNLGSSDMSNVTVHLEVTGSNTYTATPIVIPVLAAGKTQRVTFPSFSTNTVGSNSVKVYIDAVDINAVNNTMTFTQTISTNTYSYAVGDVPYTAYSTPNIAAVKYHINGTRVVKTVSAFMHSANNGKSTTAYVLDASGNIIGSSTLTTLTGNAWNTFTITTPPTITNADFYVGVNATSVNTSYPAAVQQINAINSGVNVVIPVGGGTPSDFSYAYRFMINAIIDLPSSASAPTVVTSNEVAQTTNTDVVVSGNVTNDNGAAITERGFYWSATSPVTTSSTKITSATNGMGSITETISGLTEGNTYYVAAFATNSSGTTLGNEVSFVKKTAQTITFGSLTSMTYEDADVSLTATASSSLPVTYTSDNTDVATIVETPASSGNYFIHVVGAGTCNITAKQAGDGTYAIASDVSQALVVNKKTIIITIPDLTRTFDYTPQVVVPTPGGYNYSITYNGSKYAPVDGGSYTVVATIVEDNYQGTKSETLVINKISATVEITNLSQTADGTPKPVTVTTTPAGLNVDITYNGSATAPTLSGDYTVVATINDNSYEGTATATLHIAPGTGVDPNEMSMVNIYSDAKDIYVNIPVLSAKSQITVYNIIGVQVYNSASPMQGINKIEDIHSSGTYIVRVIIGNKVVTQKVALRK